MVGAKALSELVGTPEHGEAIQRNKDIKRQVDALLEEINSLKRRRAGLKR
jgi:hypothetical protein